MRHVSAWIPPSNLPVYPAVCSVGRGPTPRLPFPFRRSCRYQNRRSLSRGRNGGEVSHHASRCRDVSTVEQLERRLERERRARKAAEAIAEEKTREIYETNIRLQQLHGRPGGVARAPHGGVPP